MVRGVIPGGECEGFYCLMVCVTDGEETTDEDVADTLLDTVSMLDDSDIGGEWWAQVQVVRQRTVSVDEKPRIPQTEEKEARAEYLQQVSGWFRKVDDLVDQLLIEEKVLYVQE